MKFELTKEELKKINTSIKIEFPKYTTQLMNLANQNAQGTRPKVVGTLSEIFQEFMNNNKNISIEDWREWYLKKYRSEIIRYKMKKVMLVIIPTGIRSKIKKILRRT